MKIRLTKFKAAWKVCRNFTTDQGKMLWEPWKGSIAHQMKRTEESVRWIQHRWKILTQVGDSFDSECDLRNVHVESLLSLVKQEELVRGQSKAKPTKTTRNRMITGELNRPLYLLVSGTTVATIVAFPLYAARRFKKAPYHG